MSRISVDVPILKDIFRKILKDKKPHCVVCFRTNDEVRLIPPYYIKRFMEATIVKSRIIVMLRTGDAADNIIKKYFARKVNLLLKRHCTRRYESDQFDVEIYTEGTRYHEGAVCYICERKSKQALLMYRSAVFSNNINILLDELFRRNLMQNNDVFELKFFKKILKKIGLSPKLTPEDIQGELQHIWTNNRLSQTNIVVTDSTQPIQKKPIDSDKIAPPKILNVSKVTSKRTNHTTDRDAASDDSDGNKVPETVIIDDEDEQTDNIKKIAAVGEPTNLHILTAVLDPSNTQTVPKILTMEDVQNQTNDAINFLLHDIYRTDDNKYSVPSLGADIVDGTVLFYNSNKQIISKQPLAWCADFLKQNTAASPVIVQKNKNTIDNNKMTDDNIQNNTIVLFNNDTQSNDLGNDSCEKDPLSLNVPCDQAIILNSIDTNQNKGLVVANDGNGVLQRFMMLPEGISNINSLVSKVNVVQNKLAVGGIENNVVSSQNSTTVKNNRKRKNTSNIPILPKVIGISHKLTGTSNKTGTDWEDKIPMDVISFVDAVDPNAHEMLTPRMVTSLDTIKISEPVSLAKKHPVNIDNDVVDLC